MHENLALSNWQARSRPASYACAAPHAASAESIPVRVQVRGAGRGRDSLPPTREGIPRITVLTAVICSEHKEEGGVAAQTPQERDVELGLHQQGLDDLGYDEAQERWRVSSHGMCACVSAYSRMGRAPL